MTIPMLCNRSKLNQDNSWLFYKYIITRIRVCFFSLRVHRQENLIVDYPIKNIQKRVHTNMIIIIPSICICIHVSIPEY